MLRRYDMILCIHRHLVKKQGPGEAHNSIKTKRASRSAISKAYLALEARLTDWHPLSSGVCVCVEKKEKEKEKNSSSRVAPCRRAILRSSKGRRDELCKKV